MSLPSSQPGGGYRPARHHGMDKEITMNKRIYSLGLALGVAGSTITGPSMAW